MTKSWVRSNGANNAKVVNGRRRSPHSMAKAFRISQTQTYKRKQKQTNYKNNNDVRDGLAESINADVSRKTKLYISNLDGRVSDEDIRELFSAFGDLKSWALHFDRKGELMGTADVVYFDTNDAATAWKRYNNVPLDGKPMNIEFVGQTVVDRKSNLDSHPNVNKRRGRTAFVGKAKHGFRKRNEGNYRRGRGREKGGNGRKNSTISAAQLDMDLESYHAQAN